MLPRRAPHESCSKNLRWPREVALTGRRRPRSWSQEPWAPKPPRRSSQCPPWPTSQQIGAARQVVRDIQYAEVSERLAQAQHTEDSIAFLARRVTRIENALRSLAARLDHDALVEFLREPSEAPDGGSTISMHGSSARSARSSFSLQVDAA